MRIALIVIAASASLAAAAPALAAPKHKAKATIARCQSAPARPWLSLFEFRPTPRPNGCAPAVHNYGRYIGQDPDPAIRQQLLRDPATGYAPL